VVTRDDSGYTITGKVVNDNTLSNLKILTDDGPEQFLLPLLSSLLLRKAVSTQGTQTPELAQPTETVQPTELDSLFERAVSSIPDLLI